MSKDRFDGAPIGLRLTKTDADTLKRLSKSMYDGMTVSVSDVARLLLHAGLEAYGLGPGRNRDLDEPIVRLTFDTGSVCSGK